MSKYKLEKLPTIHHGTMMKLMKGEYKSVNLKTVMLIIKAFGIKTTKFFDCHVFDSSDLGID